MQRQKYQLVGELVEASTQLGTTEWEESV
ncbi:hypothetical protein CCACVL1_06591 [Corchorus capsularis]|uniref:Uncharacterized protein n=1 Tax=Corchorus capsularis TaxID=210143 RepID=A0A1R3JEC9_COCAP|nr:hypothetical protein CCACVL1_06591 [Corchorus capsularis]